MKPLKIFAILFIAAITTAKAQFTKAELQVSGLTCSMCSNATEKSLKKLTFIDGIKADLDHNLFVITFKKGADVNLDQISQRVQAAGFAVNSLKATFDFNNTEVSNNYHFNYNGNTYHFLNVGDKTLNGPVAVTLLDKNFVPAATYKKYAAQPIACYKTGKMGNTRIYHVTI